MKNISLKANFIFQLVYELLLLLLPFATSPYIARVLGADCLGLYSYTYTVAMYFVLISMLGIRNYASRVIAKVRHRTVELNVVFSALLNLHIFSSIISLLLYFIYAYYFSVNKSLSYIQGIVVISALFDVSWFFYGLENFRTTVIVSTIAKILTVISVFCFVKSSNDLEIYCLIMALGHLMSQIPLCFLLKKSVSYVRVDFSDIITHIKPLLVLFIPFIAISLYKYMDKLMLGYMCDMTQLGLYENAEKVSSLPNTLIAAFGVVMLPRISNLISLHEDDKVDMYMLYSVRYIMCISIGITFGMMAVGVDFAPLFWGADFGESGNLIVGLSLTIPFLAMGNILRTQYLIPQQQDRIYIYSVVCGAIVNVISNIILIPYMQAWGAVIGTIFAEATVCLMQIFSVLHKLPIIAYIKEIMPMFGIGLLMLIIEMTVFDVQIYTWLEFIFKVSIGFFIYTILSVIYLNAINDSLLFKVKEYLFIK